MYHYEVCEIGRESVKSVNASILATLIKELVTKCEKSHNSKQQHRKFYVKCREKLELTPKKNKKLGGGDDEGFESDGNEEDSLSGDLSNEDAQSTTSSCCLVEDHVFKSSKLEIIHQSSFERDPTSLVSIIGSIDSANSSGSSDTDELDVHSLTPSPVSQSKKQIRSTLNSYVNHEKKQRKNKKEEYPIADVIFCHTEPKYPDVIAWVIKKPQSEADYGSRLGTSGVESYSKMENCLEVIVVKCKNGDNLKDLCSNYQEYSKRIKLDQYKTIKRKRDEKHMSMTLTKSISSKDVKVSLSDMKIANSSLIKASELSILNPKIITSFKNDLKNSISLNSLIKPEPTVHNISVTQDQKSASPTLHSSVKKTQSLINLSKTWDLKSDTLSRDGSIYRDKISPLGDQFNLIQRTDLNGVTHLEVSKARDNTTVLTEKFPSNKSKLRKEIEGVILTDVESYAKKEQIRQRQGSEDGESPDKIYDAPPPIRPERKKYLKKKTGAVQTLEGIQSEQKIKPPQQATKTTGSFFLTLQPKGDGPKDQKVIRGPYVRVQSWGSQNVVDSALGTWRSEQRSRHVNKYEDKYVDRRRSKSAGRTPKKTPMAYRYVDVTNDYRGNLALKSGMPQKVREVNANLTDNMHNGRRRKSLDDIIALDSIKGNLKSVIKKNKKINDKYCEPKKVTFSAFATVQVVD